MIGHRPLVIPCVQTMTAVTPTSVLSCVRIMSNVTRTTVIPCVRTMLDVTPTTVHTMCPDYVWCDTDTVHTMCPDYGWCDTDRTVPPCVQCHLILMNIKISLTKIYHRLSIRTVFIDFSLGLQSFKWRVTWNYVYILQSLLLINYFSIKYSIYTKIRKNLNWNICWQRILN